MVQFRGRILFAASLVLAGPGGEPGGDAVRADDRPAGTRTDRHSDPLPEGAVTRLGTVRWRPPPADGSGFARVTFSPDGKVLASTGGGLCLWDVNTGKRVPWAPDGARIRAAAFSPDGKTLITHTFAPRRGAKSLFQLWEVGTGKSLQQTEFDMSPEVTSFPSFSADGKFFVCNEQPKKVSLWDTRTGQRLVQIDQELGYGDTIGLSADNRVLAVIGRDRRLRLYDAANGKELPPVQWNSYPPEPSLTPALSADGKLLAASTSTTVCVWDTASGKMKRAMPESRGAVAFSPDGKHLACADARGIRLWETATSAEVRRFKPAHADVRGLAFSADGRLLAAATDHTVAVWDVATGNPVNRDPAHQGVVYSLAFVPPGNALVSGGDDGAAIVWDLATGKPRHELSGHDRAAAALAGSPDGKVLATGDGQPFGTTGRDAHIRLWNLADGTPVRQFHGHMHSVNRLAFAPDGTRLASTGRDGRCRVWDPDTGRQLFEIRGKEGTRALAFSPDGRTLVLGGSWGDLGLFRVDTGARARDLGTPQGDFRRRILHASFSGDGKTVFSEEGDDIRAGPRKGENGWVGPRIRLWDAESGREVRSVPVPGSSHYVENSPAGHAVSPDGTVAATVSEYGLPPAVKLWDLSSGKLFAQLRGHTGYVTALAFSPDGRLLASGSHDSTVLVWDVAESRIRHYWSELVSGTADAKTAEALVADVRAAAAFLKDRLTRSAEVEAAARRIAAHLDDDRFAVREKASRELARLGVPEAILRQLAEEARSAEARQRVQAILGGSKTPDKVDAVLGPARVRMAVALLERIDAPESRRALEELARGPAETTATREARAALERLKKPGKDR